MQAVKLLNYLPPAHRQGIKDRLKLQRRKPFFSSFRREQIELLCCPSLNRLQQGKGKSTDTFTACGKTYRVGHFIANQRLCTAKEHGQKNLMPLDTRWNRTIFLIDNLDKRKIFKEM